MGISPKNELVRFLSEDIGKGDITSNLLDGKKIHAKIFSNEDGVLAGIKYAKEIFKIKHSNVKILTKDGKKIKKNQIILTISGSPQSILSSERTVLNLLSRMSGIATQTNSLVKKISTKKVQIYATRKTAPGLRFFDKEAVEIGGGKKHRMNLEKMIMIKDNHIIVADSLVKLIRKAKQKHKTIEVEVENQNEAVIAAKEGASIIMLDNFTPEKISKTVNQLTKLGLRKRVKLEASGGITSKNIIKYSKTGVDSISIGQITNSVKGIDFSLEVYS